MVVFPGCPENTIRHLKAKIGLSPDCVNFYWTTSCERYHCSGVISRDTLWDKLVFRRVQQSLGGRVKFIISGSAPLSSVVHEWLRCVFGCAVSGRGNIFAFNCISDPKQDAPK